MKAITITVIITICKMLKQLEDLTVYKYSKHSCATSNRI